MEDQAHQGPKTASTGNMEIDKKLGGGIPLGSLTLVEGQSDAGKSVFCQHITSGSLESGLGVAYYTAENTVKSLVNQMASLNLDIMDYLLVDQLRIFPMNISARNVSPDKIFSRLTSHVERLSAEYQVVIVDSITTVVSHSGEANIIDFFSTCKRLCDRGRTVFLVVHSYAFDERMLIRIRSLCDSHLRLRLEQVEERLIKVLEVAKVRNAERTTGNIVSFDVEPGMGIRIIPISKAKA